MLISSLEFEIKRYEIVCVEELRGKKEAKTLLDWIIFAFFKRNARRLILIHKIIFRFAVGGNYAHYLIGDCLMREMIFACAAKANRPKNSLTERVE